MSSNAQVHARYNDIRTQPLVGDGWDCAVCCKDMSRACGCPDGRDHRAASCCTGWPKAVRNCLQDVRGGQGHGCRGGLAGWGREPPLPVLPSRGPAPACVGGRVCAAAACGAGAASRQVHGQVLPSSARLSLWSGSLCTCLLQYARLLRVGGPAGFGRPTELLSSLV